MKRIADRFILEREVGSGGMARVFLGRDEVLDRPVAVKVLKPMHGDTEIGARFRREGRTAARLSHPNIVQVYDAGEDDLDGREVSYIVMEYLSGGDLKGLIDEKGPLPAADLARIGEEVCSGLAHAHGRGIVHRDIKPHNILLEESGRAKVSDFGIARALDTTQATKSGAYLGTALYSAPEQLQGHKVTPKSDVYSLGATLYQAAVGEAPFSGTPIEVASQHVSKTPPPLRGRGADVDERLEALILACLAKNAEDRPSADEARSRFAEYAPTSGTILAQAAAAAPPREERPRPAPTTEQPGGRAGRVQRRGRGVLATVAILAVLAVIGALALADLPGGGGNTAQNDPAQNNAPQNDQANAGGSDGGGGGGNENEGSQDEQVAGGSGGGEPTATSSASPSVQPGGLTEEAAAQTVEDFYSTAASPDYQDSWNFLSSGYQQDLGSRGRMTNQFQTLESVEFTSGPTAQVDGNTATVSFSTVARHTDRVERPSGTATLVRDGDNWRIDSLSFG